MTASPTRFEPLWDLVEESLEESSFLLKRWEAELGSLTRNLDEVFSWTEDRLQGALDGARVAGEEIGRITEAGLAGEDLARVTACAHLLAAKTPASARALLAQALSTAEGPRLWAIVRGIELADLDGSFAPVTTMLTSSKRPEHAAVLCRLKSFRRSKLAREVGDAFASNEPALQIEALRAAGYSQDESFTQLIATALASDHPDLRQAAIESGIRRRLPNAWAAAVQLAHARSAQAAGILNLLALLGSPDEHQVVINALRDPALQKAGVAALGSIGTPEAVEICLTGMRDPNLARIAGETYCAITGAELERDHLAAAEPPDAESPPPIEKDDLDADLVPAPEELWPLPNVDAVRKHWESVKSQYSSGVRYLRGRKADMNVLIGTIASGPMNRRPGLILEATVRTGGKYDVEARAFAHVQRRMAAQR